MKGLANAVTQILEKQGIIQPEDVDKCMYGLDMFTAAFLELFSIFVISAFVGNFFETLLFFLMFIPLRIYAGGYHADTKARCYIVSLLVYVCFTLVMKYVPQSLLMPIALEFEFFSMIMVYTAAPVIHKNKHVNDIEKVHYKNASIIICTIETAVICILMLFDIANIAFALSAGQFAETASMGIALIKNKILTKNAKTKLK